jgi:hypothetical protein
MTNPLPPGPYAISTYERRIGPFGDEWQTDFTIAPLATPHQPIALFGPKREIAEEVCARINRGGWQPAETAPKDGTIFYVGTAVKWKPYKPNSEQARRGIKGRWMESNGYGGWYPLAGDFEHWAPLPEPSPTSSEDS